MRGFGWVHSQWTDRTVTALVTLLLGAGAQGLMSWRELSVLSNRVAVNELQSIKTNLEITKRLEDVGIHLHDVSIIVAKVQENSMYLKESIQEHKKEHRFYNKK